MAFINEQTKEIHCKIIYYGPAMCGKTTTLRAIFDEVKKNSKEVAPTLFANEDRTLYFDFVPVDLGKHNKYQIRLHLYTVPGQVAYKAARKIICKGVDGVVFMADSQLERLEENLKSMMELKELVEEEESEFENLPLVLQYNKRDLPQAIAVDELRRLLNPAKLPDFESVATQGKGVFEALKAVGLKVLKSLKD